MGHIASCANGEMNIVLSKENRNQLNVNIQRHQIKDPATRCIPCKDHMLTFARVKFAIFPIHKINEKKELFQTGKKNIS